MNQITLKTFGLFTDNMVLQRDQPAPIWGRSLPGDSITVEFAGQQKTVTAGTDGKWQVTLDPLKVSTEPRTVVVKSKQEQRTLKFENVLVGDVWLCSGQSNMDWSVALSANAETEIPAANFPLIRHFLVNTGGQLVVPDDIHSTWNVCSPETVADFSGVAYFFARELTRELGVPIGLIKSSVGGTQIESWTSRMALMTDPKFRRDIEIMEEWQQTAEGRAAIANPEKFSFDVQKWVSEHGNGDPGNTGFAKGWAGPRINASEWSEMKLPAPWQSEGHNYSGVFWFRRTVEVPASWAGRDLILDLGACDKTDTTYFNNELVGAVGFETKDCWGIHRSYRIPGRLIKAGANVVAVRVHSNVFQGGMVGPGVKMRLMLPDSSEPPIALAGVWKYRVEHNLGYVTPIPRKTPDFAGTLSVLYIGKILPLAPVALKGVIWYQGESNAGDPVLYRTVFPLMIRDWRRTFSQPQLPFYFVQLANFTALQKSPVESGWAELREAQMLGLNEPNTGVAMAIDIGEAEDIHPRNKQEVGRRLALNALAKTYGKSVVYSGPIYKSHSVEGSSIRVQFDHVSGGLKTTDGGPVKGFVLAGANAQYAWADARIDGNTVVVQSSQVPQPVHVRYGWANNPIINLVNAAGLPASPFRTDMK